MEPASATSQVILARSWRASRGGTQPQVPRWGVRAQNSGLTHCTTGITTATGFRQRHKAQNERKAGSTLKFWWWIPLGYGIQVIFIILFTFSYILQDFYIPSSVVSLTESSKKYL